MAHAVLFKKGSRIYAAFSFSRCLSSIATLPLRIFAHPFVSRQSSPVTVDVVMNVEVQVLITYPRTMGTNNPQFRGLQKTIFPRGKKSPGVAVAHGATYACGLLLLFGRGMMLHLAM